VNTTPHQITFLVNGEDVVIPPSGVLINAAVDEEIVVENGIMFSKPRFVPEPASEAILQELVREYPDILVLGSIIAAQAYPGKVLGLCPAPGFERVPVQDKRMHASKFTRY